MVTLSSEQAQVVAQIVAWYGKKNQPEFYLAGYAGVGKSTIAEVAIQAIRAKYRISEVRTGAFCGKAAFVLRKKGCPDASTIHRMIYTLADERGGSPIFVLDPNGAAASADLIVLDEVSMVGEDIATDLRSFRKKTLVLGDPGQLPPVGGAGAFTKREPDALLTQIHRQSADSPILVLATMLREGKMPAYGEYGQDVRVVPWDEAAGQHVYDPATQVIVGTNKNRWNLTQKIRRRAGIEARYPQKGEPILCCRNSKGHGLFNGQLGTLVREHSSLTHGAPYRDMEVRMEDSSIESAVTVHPYLFDQHFSGPSQRPQLPRDCVDLDFGYVLTCHKAQGSQFPRVTVLDDSACFREDKWRWLYTAVTRAESGITLVTKDAP